MVDRGESSFDAMCREFNEEALGSAEKSSLNELIAFFNSKKDIVSFI